MYCAMDRMTHPWPDMLRLSILLRQVRTKLLGSPAK